MKLKLVAAFSMMGTVSSFAATGIFGSYVQVTTDVDTVYYAQQFSTASNSFQGADLGDFTTSATLNLSNASVLTFKNGGSNVTGAQIQYRVYEASATPGSFTPIGINFGSDASSTSLGGQAFTGGGDQEWRGLQTAAVDLIAAVGSTPGDYKLEVFLKSFTSSDGDQFSNDGGNNYTADFTVVPEPSALLLGAIGSLILLRRRK